MYYNSRGCYYSKPVNYYEGMYEDYYPYRYNNNYPNNNYGMPMPQPVILQEGMDTAVSPVTTPSTGGAFQSGFSARNRFPGVVTDIKVGSVVGEVLVDVACNQKATAVITTASIKNLGLKKGSKVSVVIKATQILVRKGVSSDSGFSARNEFPGTVIEVKKGSVVGEVSVDIGCGNIATAVITTTSINNLGLTVGVKATAVVKATQVLIQGETE